MFQYSYIRKIPMPTSEYDFATGHTDSCLLPTHMRACVCVCVQCEIETRKASEKSQKFTKKKPNYFQNWAARRRTAKVAKIRRKQRKCDKAFVPLQSSAKRAKTKENSVDSNTSVFSSSSSSSSGRSFGRGTERWAVGAEAGRGTAENETLAVAAAAATTTNAGRFITADLIKTVNSDKQRDRVAKGHRDAKNPLDATKHLRLSDCLRTVQKLAIELESADAGSDASAQANASGDDSSAVMSETGCRHYQSYVKEHSYDTFRVIDAYFAACVNRDARERKVSSEAWKRVGARMSALLAW